jgi:serine/threonine-protein kinase
MSEAEPPSGESVTAEVSAEGLDPLVGRTIDGRFRIVEVIGKGAMGKVFRAVQVPLNRAVALKVLDSRYGAGRDESFKQRFLVEASMTARLSHPNTVRVLDYGSTPDGLFFLAMEYLDGETLEAVLARGALPWRRVLTVGQQIARALKEAHSLGVVHRDLKPGNVVLLDADDDTDHVKVLDFGLVKSFVDGHELEGRAITQTGMLMGSPPYMAPEQGERNRADPRSDIYSLGVVLFEALTGKPPFTGGAALEIIMKHVHQAVPPLVTPANFEPPPALLVGLVNKCLAKSPMDRFQAMDEVLAAMAEITSPIPTPMDVPASDPVIPVPATSTVVPPPSGSRPTTLVLGFALALVVGIGGTLLVVRPSREAPPPVRVEAPAPVPTPPPHPTSAIIHVETDPAGATVTFEGTVLGQTPLDVERPTDASGSVSAQLVLTKPGFLELRVTAGGSGQVQIRQKLQPAPVVVKEKDKDKDKDEKKPELRPAVGETRPPEISVAPPEKV